MPPLTEEVRRAVRVVYTNWRGETQERVIVPEPNTFRFCSTEHHPIRQWVFDAWDVGKQAVRTFAMSGISSWKFEFPPREDMK